MKQNPKFVKPVLLLITALLLVGCSRIGLFGKRGSGRPKLDAVEQLRLSYLQGEVQSLDELIKVYLDETAPTDVRIAAGRAMAATHHPSALEALTHVVGRANGLDLTFMEASIDIMTGFTDDPLAAEALVQAMHNVEEKTNSLHLQLVKALGKVRTRDQIFSLLDLYEISKANLARTEKLLAETLGTLGNDEVVPILTSIARDPQVNISVRNRAIEILGKKETADVVGSFAELLGDPATGEEVRDFALNTMAGVKEEKLILALLDTYNSGKRQYYSLLNTLLDALGEFDDPEIKQAVVEIVLNPEFPLTLREKALKGLVRFKDPTLVPRVIPLLEDPANYHLYDAIRELAAAYDKDGRYLETLRRMALAAHRKGGAGE
ncbi:MAG: hypothetical protein ABIA75_08285 [Candidatus Neomarinimicrobiota bacterium]